MYIALTFNIAEMCHMIHKCHSSIIQVPPPPPPPHLKGDSICSFLSPSAFNFWAPVTIQSWPLIFYIRAPVITHHWSLIFGYTELCHLISIVWHMLHILPFLAPNFKISSSQMYPFVPFCYCILPDFPFLTPNSIISLALLTHLSSHTN